MSARVANPAKRPVRQLSVREKLEAIRRVHEGESKASVARVIGVPESTLRGWCKNEDKLHAMAVKGSPSPEPGDRPLDGPSDSKRSKSDDGKPELDEALRFWLRNQQRQQAAVPETPKGVAETGGWFWRWYKHYGFQDPPREPLPLVKSDPASDAVLLNINNNDEAKENEDVRPGDPSEDEDDPPETAAEALKHGQKFLRWLECCSDPSVTAVQLLQFRYLLNNVRTRAQRRADRAAAAPRSRRK
ncbi:hypothetical protein AAG570_012494 [Ranatra chinensis]|uniref:HTH psq-type domain-containing protein n=1 Tax=Ranatra chinensis TaxID=642074 RepID=A0ABD0YEP1_9HEMI